jgi:trehalose/maltose transport system permease protein
MIYVIAIIICLLALFPFYWAFITSLKTGASLFEVEFFPKQASFENYHSIFFAQPFAKNLLNSILIAGVTVSIATLIGLFASYALARNKFRGRRLILFSFLFVSMFPQIAVLSGLFELLRAFNLFNQKAGLVSVYLIFTLPFMVWTLNVFMRDVPKEVEEAAILDGASPRIIIQKIFVPMLTPSLVTTGILGFIAAWNEFLFALTFSLTDKSRTVPVAIAMMSGASEHEIPWGLIMAASVTVTLPIVAAVLFFQKRIVSGLTAGSVKG